MAKKEKHPNSLANLIKYKKGKSGNPAGRKKGSQNFKKIIDNFLGQNSDQVDEATGELLTNQEVIVLEQLKKAKEGCINAFKELVDRSDGKAVQTSIVDQTNHFPEIVEIELVEPKEEKEVKKKDKDK